MDEFTQIDNNKPLTNNQILETKDIDLDNTQSIPNESLNDNLDFTINSENLEELINSSSN